MRFILAIFILCSALSGFAQSREATDEQQKQIDEYNDALAGKDPMATESKEPVPESAPKSQPEKPVKLTTRTISAGINYSPFDLFVPSKFGATAGWKLNPKSAIELEYLRSSLSVPFLFEALGGMTDHRLSLIMRNRFKNGSFNYFYGLAYHMFDVRVGNELISRAIPHAADFDELTLNSLGVVLGIGNRWEIYDSVQLGVDWISWSQPILETSRKTEFLNYVAERDRGRIEDVLDFVDGFPRFAAAKLYLGMLF